MKDMFELTGLSTYDEVKRGAEEREIWWRMVAKFQYKVEK
jgi:hypothetical protein